jgi:hypothetical protein
VKGQQRREFHFGRDQAFCGEQCREGDRNTFKDFLIIECMLHVSREALKVVANGNGFSSLLPNGAWTCRVLAETPDCALMAASRARSQLHAAGARRIIGHNVAYLIRLLAQRDAKSPPF